MGIDVGIVLREVETGSTWRVVSYDFAWVRLSGPGPCRGMKTLHRRDLDEGWEVVS